MESGEDVPSPMVLRPRLQRFCSTLTSASLPRAEGALGSSHSRVSSDPGTWGWEERPAEWKDWRQRLPGRLFPYSTRTGGACKPRYRALGFCPFPEVSGWACLLLKRAERGVRGGVPLGVGSEGTKLGPLRRTVYSNR